MTLAAGHVLGGPGDTTRDVQLGSDLGAGLPDLVGVRPPAGACDHTQAAHSAAQQTGQLLDDREALLGANPAATADDDLRLGKRNATAGAVDVASDLHHEVRGFDLRQIGLQVDVDGRRALGHANGVRGNGDQGTRTSEQRVLEQAATPSLADDPHRVAWLGRDAVGGEG